MRSVVPGTVAFEAVQFLRRSGKREFSTSALARELGRSAKRLTKHLYPAVRAGLVVRRVCAGQSFWSRGYAEITIEKPVICVQPGPLAFPSVFHYAAAVASSEVSL